MIASAVNVVKRRNDIFVIPAGIEIAWRTTGMKRAVKITPVP